MSSPPYRSPAASPPNLAHAVLPAPRKRPIGAAPGVPSAFKKRKQSSFSATSTSHPLRQTSFPPEESLGIKGERSPSVDSDVSGVTGNQSTAASTTGRKRGKKKRIDAVSTKSGDRPRAGESASRTGAADDDAEADYDDADLDDEEDMVDEGAMVDQAAEQEKMAVLLDAFSGDQSDRYDAFRRAKLRKETVRRISNQTLSQSVPPSVVTTINAFTKIFMGTLIESARDVQKQWAAAEDSLPSPSTSTGDLAKQSVPKGDLNSSQTFAASQGTTIGDETPKDGYLGPLLPDHIREAFRRYKQDGFEGGAGISGASVGLGVSGAGAARIREKRMFR